VTVFLFNEGEILLLKRSEKVSTYKGKWAGVSGYIEEGERPLERAVKEIREETGIEDPELLREGEPFEVYDEDNQRAWRVHPFLFKVSSRRVSIDWEHSEYKWIKPEDIGKYEVVPALERSLKAVVEVR
jgi:8-oxo-dGTP pyrophosphatase MutT (NUDIX family)